jgi:hypothetical protein
MPPFHPEPVEGGGDAWSRAIAASWFDRLTLRRGNRDQTTAGKFPFNLRSLLRLSPWGEAGSAKPRMDEPGEGPAKRSEFESPLTLTLSSRGEKKGDNRLKAF